VSVAVEVNDVENVAVVVGDDKVAPQLVGQRVDSGPDFRVGLVGADIQVGFVAAGLGRLDAHRAVVIDPAVGVSDRALDQLGQLQPLQRRVGVLPRGMQPRHVAA
jgi:hypothetical protein